MIERYLELHKDRPNTYSAYSSALKQFFNKISMTPEEFVELCKSDLEKGETIVQEYIDTLVNRDGKAIKSTRNIHYYAIRGFLKFYHVELIRQIKVRGESQNKYSNQTIPTQEELGLMFSATRNKTESAILSIVAYTGLRPGIITGLMFKNFPELVQVEDGTFKFKYAPTLIEIFSDNEGNKTNLHQHTFLIRDGMVFLKQYLDDKFNNCAVMQNNRIFPDITTERMRNIMKRLLVYAGIHNTRPYVMRSYFISAVASSGINETLSKHYSSHSNIDTRYAFERKLNMEQINEMREEFREKIEPRIIRKNTTNML